MTGRVRMEGKYTFRLVDTVDLQRIAQLYSEMYLEQKEMGMVMDFNDSEIEGLLAAQLKSKFFTSLLVEEEGTIIGFAVGSIGRMPKKYSFKDEVLIGYIQDLYITKSHRKSGIGQVLLEKLEDEFRKEGITYVELHVLTRNEVGKSFWSRNGYEDVIQTMYKTL